MKEPQKPWTDGLWQLKDTSFSLEHQLSHCSSKAWLERATFVSCLYWRSQTIRNVPLGPTFVWSFFPTSFLNFIWVTDVDENLPYFAVYDDRQREHACWFDSLLEVRTANMPLVTPNLIFVYLCCWLLLSSVQCSTYSLTSHYLDLNVLLLCILRAWKRA